MTIQVFEHDCLYIGSGTACLKDYQLKTLQEFFKPSNFPYYSLVNNGVLFCEYVGVLQVGDLTIEVLPKVERNTPANEKGTWQKVLIDMLRLSGIFKIAAPSIATLNLKSNSVLDLYFELFISEVEVLMRKGLIKRYTKKEGNLKALKGKLCFAKHIQQNLVHKERFYVQYTTYSPDHVVNQILYKTLSLLNHINRNISLNSRIGALLLDFPELKDINVTDATFDRIYYDRKTEGYSTAISIARLLLLNYHPDIRKGHNDVLALMFDMNDLWEKFVLATIRKCAIKDENIKVVSGQEMRHFWRRTPRGRYTPMYADITITTTSGKTIVLDTKWKNFDNYKPNPDDLRQMYVYHDFYMAEKVALVYPSVNNTPLTGLFAIPGAKADSKKECSLLPLPVNKDTKKWQKDIYHAVTEWIYSDL